MEYILAEDLKRHLEVLKKYIRPVGSADHPTLVNGSVRQVDFLLSPDGKTALPSAGGLSFVTSMKKFKGLLKLKARHVGEVDVYAFDDALALPPGLEIVRDRPGHASLRVKEKMALTDLIGRLEDLGRRMERIGRIRLTND
jgi:hypothetical protein